MLRQANLTNISSTQCSSPVLSLSVNTKNQITNTGFTYDNGGNLTSDGTHAYTWDAENHLTSANGVTYVYDGLGRRVKKSPGTLYWYGVGGNVLEETDLAGNLQNDYVFLRGERVAKRDSAGAVYLYLKDVVGSTAMLTDANANVKSASNFYPFGGERVLTSTVANNYKFTGLERDSETGLDHTLFRQYSSSMGRWLSPDPICKGCTNPQKLNRYQYALNNPVTFTDPTGLDPTCGTYTYEVENGLPVSVGVSCGPGGEALFEVEVDPNAAPTPAPGGGDGGSNFIHVSNPSKTGPNEQRIRTVLDWIKNDMDPDCAKWLAGVGDAITSLEGGDGSNLDTVLAGHGTFDPLISAFTFNNARYTDLPPGYAMAINDAGAFFVSSYTDPSGKKIQLSNGGYTGGTSQAQGFILLHELAHFLTVPGFENDLGDSGAQSRNDKRIKDHCKGTLNAAKNIP